MKPTDSIRWDQIPSSKALQYALETLEVAFLDEMPRHETAKAVAKRHSVTVPTVEDKLGARHGGAGAAELDRLIESCDLDGLRNLLLKRFSREPDHASVIRKFIMDLRALDPKPPGPKPRHPPLIFTPITDEVREALRRMLEQRSEKSTDAAGSSGDLRDRQVE